ncbi:MAG TPA: GNAT family N-acetyltransferase [Leptolyngbyaceae cyanobacterium]
MWVVECDRHIVAVARLDRRPQYSQITSLYVTPRYRQRGLGSCLLQKLIQEANKPVFLFCLPELVGFYARFGFIRASKENVPPQLRFLIHDRFTFLTLFLPDPAVSLPPVAANKVNRLANSLNGSYVIRQVQFREVNKIQKMIFNSANLDILLPFGLSLKTIYSLVTLVTKLFILMLIIGWVGLLIIVILPSSGSGIASEMKKYDDYRWITESVFTLAIYYAGGLFVLMVIAVISGFAVSRQHSNFWIAERNSKIVGYARLSSCDRYSILHYLHIDNEHLTQSLDSQLIDHLSQTVRKPIYLACSAEFAQRYRRLGFIPVSTRNLPQKLRFGGIINQQFGGSNLVLR